MTFVIDTSAVIRYLDGEAGWEEVRSVFIATRSRRAVAIISAVNWGEVAGNLYKRSTRERATAAMAQLLTWHLAVVEVTAVSAVESAILSKQFAISYADSFGVQLAQASSNHILVTADYGVKPAEHLVRIQFLPTKPTP